MIHRRIAATVAAVAAVLALGVAPVAAATAHDNCTAGPSPAYLVTYKAVTSIQPLAGAKLYARVMAYDRIRRQAPGVTMYRVACWNDKPRDADRVSVRRIRHHRWAAYTRHGRHLIFRFRLG